MLLLSREKKMNKDVLRFFFRNGIAHLMLFFTWEKYNPALTRNMGEIIFSFRIFTPAGLLNIIKVCRDTPS